MASRVSVFAMLEVAMVVESRAAMATENELDVLPEETAVELVPVTPDPAKGARRAWRRSGRGNYLAALRASAGITYQFSEGEMV